MSALVIVLIALGVLVLLVLIGGFVAVNRRNRELEGRFSADVAAADRALEEARAADRGWDRGVMEAAVRQAVAEARPGWAIESLHLVLVDDRPGVAEDRAQFLATGGGEQVRVGLARQEAGWVAESVD